MTCTYTSFILSLLLLHDSLLDIDAQNTCRYFCQLEAWTNEVEACGLDIPDVVTPNFTNFNATESPEDLQQLTVDAGEVADGAWAGATSEFSLDLPAPVYGSESQNYFLIYIVNIHYTTCTCIVHIN